MGARVAAARDDRQNLPVGCRETDTRLARGRRDGCRPAADEPEPDPPRAERWYGWQIAAIDAPLLLVVATSTDGGGEASIVAGAALLASGPIIHGVHGNSGAAFGSVAARVLAPLLGAAVGASTGHGEHEPGDGHSTLEGVAYGALAGYAVALGFDMVLARTEVEPERPPPAAPVVMVGSSSATIGLAGNF